MRRSGIVRYHSLLVSFLAAGRICSSSTKGNAYRFIVYIRWIPLISSLEETQLSAFGVRGRATVAYTKSADKQFRPLRLCLTGSGLFLLRAQIHHMCRAGARTQHALT